MKRVSINIVNWNGLHFLSDCLESVKSQTYKNIEINVVDNASSDGSVDFLAARYPGVNLIKNAKNEGFSRAHNQAIRISSGEYIIPLNFDITLTSTFVEEMVKAAEASPEIGIVSGRLYILRGGEKTHTIDSTGITMQGMFPADRGQNENNPAQYDKAEYVFGASGAAPLFKHEMLEDIKLNGEYFDEDFFIYVEDVDLCWRAQLYGWRTIYTPSAIAYHYRGATRKGDSGMKREYLIIGYRNRYWSIVKNAVMLNLLKNILWIAIVELSFYAGYLLGRNFFILKVPCIVLKGAPGMLRKRSVIQKKRRVSASYMEGFFFGDIKNFVKDKFKRMLKGV
ncbi:MAG: glycosyltransferase family 2 protein [Nitrospirae bacterium]|nr:glycosyltransferase family 2 protein [Nitrospirota bacterium]MCL5236813.1 glycosyltransferase family 2 protein [Nitrospirota bacterium]